MEYPVIVSFRNVRGISMRATKAGEIRVTAPLFMSRRRVAAFVESHREWMDAAVARTLAAARNQDDFYSRLQLGTKAQRSEAVARLDAIVKPLVEAYSGRMGVKPSAISYKAIKSRWGSCNSRSGHINLSIYLLLLPEWCIEHVVVHEMAHLLVPNHSAAFYALMDRYFPRWKEARKETRSILYSKNAPGLSAAADSDS